MDLFINILIIIGIFGGLALIFGCLLVVASRFFAVKQDERAEKIIALLPGANCGGCGYAGCASYAEAVLSGEAKPNLCTSLSQEEINAIAEISGAEASEKSLPTVAHIKCCGSNECTSNKYNYGGIDDCRSLIRLGGGEKSCVYSCIGLGNCVKACVFGAISVKDGIAAVDTKRCKGCGSCVAACPKSLIELIPATARFSVCCNSKDKGKAVNANCDNGCIACGICVKNCPNSAITLKNNCAVIDYSLCDGCGICAEKCPKGTIRSTKGGKKAVKSSAPAVKTEKPASSTGTFSFDVKSTDKD